LFKEGVTNEIITNFDKLAPLNDKKDTVQISYKTLDNDNDNIADTYAIDIIIYDNPNNWDSLTLVLPVKVLVDGTMSFIMNDYIIVSVDGPFATANLIGDIAIRQKRIINQK
jgi:hypothetical protein